MTILRIDFWEDGVTPENVREVLARFGKVEEVSIHSGNCQTYALVDLPSKEAEEAQEHLFRSQWRGLPITVEFADEDYDGVWLQIHQWRPPKRRSRR